MNAPTVKHNYPHAGQLNTSNLEGVHLSNVATIVNHVAGKVRALVKAIRETRASGRWNSVNILPSLRTSLPRTPTNASLQ